MSAIEAKGLTKVYRTYKKESGLRGSIKGLVRRKYDETRAADEVSFQIEQGELVGFLGPNGAGKTTVLKMLSGLLNPTAGEARVLGFVPWERRNEMKRQFSLLMGQKNALWWDLPAQESLELNRAIYGIDRARFRQVVDGLSELLDVQRLQVVGPPLGAEAVHAHPVGVSSAQPAHDVFARGELVLRRDRILDVENDDVGAGVCGGLEPVGLRAVDQQPTPGEYRVDTRADVGRIGRVGSDLFRHVSMLA